MPLGPGTTLGPYAIEEPLGKGGMGEVYRAQDTKLDRKVAVKVLVERLATNADALARFEREAKAVAAVSHPNILSIFDFGAHNNVTYIVTELLDGESLRARLQGSALSWQRAAGIATAVAEGTAAAHARGIIHRDLKPENIFLTSDKIVKILDFGLARSERSQPTTDQTVTLDTRPGTVLGTVQYMAPEQVRGQKSDARTDIFALGCILFEMVTGSRPFNGTTAADVSSAILTQDAAAPSHEVPGLPSELSALILRCLEKQPQQRFQTCEDLAFALRGIQSASTGSATQDNRSRTAKQLAPSIVVLPFTNMSVDPENEFLSDGISEELINLLAKVQNLKVAARTSAFSFKGQNVDIAQVGKQLNVTTALEGSVRRAGDRIRVTAQLINIEDGCSLWSERFDRKLDDIFGVQEEIASAIASKLQLTLSSGIGGSPAKPPTENMEAYELYLKGRHLVGRGYGMDLLGALRLFEQAVSLDAKFAMAHAAIGETYSSLGYMATLPPRESMPKAKVAVERALKLDDSLAEAHCAQGCISMLYDWEWEKAKRHLQYAIELNPNFMQAYYHYGHPYCAFVAGDFDEGIDVCRRAMEMDPLAANPVHGYFANLYVAGRHNEALEPLKESLQRTPDSFHQRRILALCFLGDAQLSEAIETIAIAVRDSGRHPWALYELCAMLEQAGEREKAVAIFNELKARSRTSYVQSVVLAMAAASLNYADEAFAFLDKAYEERDAILIATTTWPMCAPLWKDSRYDELLNRMHLPNPRL